MTQKNLEKTGEKIRWKLDSKSDKNWTETKMALQKNVTKEKGIKKT